MKKANSSGACCRNAGQATVEFLVALLVMIPLFFGMHYFARYSDVKHSAIQASRYVAFERTWDPNGVAKSAAQLQEETRARFFTPISTNSGLIAYRDSTAQLNPDSGRVPLWSDLEYKRLLRNFSDVSVREINTGNLNNGPVGQLQQAIGTKVFKLPAGGVMRAEVTVPLSNIAHFDVLRDINIGLPGATAIGNGVWNASGARDGPNSVCDRVTPTVAGHYIKPVTDVLGKLMLPFERNAPDVGLVLPDYVPPGSVRDTTNNPRPYANQDGNRC